MAYRLKEKRERNERLYEFWLAHQDWTLRSIANVFHISHPRVIQILHEEKKKRDEGKR